MFNRHQAEITVMQFTGHSLPVHQSMGVPWEFFSLSHFVSQFPPTRFPLLTAIGICHFLPVHHLEWHFGPGQRPKYNILAHRCGYQLDKIGELKNFPVLQNIKSSTLLQTSMMLNAHRQLVT